MSSYEKHVRDALEDAGHDRDYYDQLSPERRLRIFCRWRLGAPEWADDILEALRHFGFEVRVRASQGGEG